jgi:integrase
MTMMQPLSADSTERWNDSAPVISNAKRILRESAAVPTFGENLWSLAAMAPSRRREGLVCNFESIPRPFRLAVKKAVWLLINDGKPDRAVRRGGTRTKKWLAATTVSDFVIRIRALLKYVAKENPEVRSLRGIVSETIDAYVASLDGRIARESVGAHYTSIRLLHDLTAGLHPSERLPAPSWADDIAFLGNRGSDNSTPPMPDAVLTPMLLWSVAFVEQFAEDILAASDAINAYVPSVVQDHPLTALQAEQLINAWQRDHGNALPWTDSSSGGIALSYMCFKLNWDTRYVRGGFKARLSPFPHMVVSDNPACPIPTPVYGTVHGRCWQPKGLDFYRLNAHRTDLQSACMFLLGLNSSMRPEELLNLELKILRDDGTKCPLTERVEAPDGQVRHLLYGRTFKGQDGVDGTHRPDGVVRTWAITELGATAVRVLDRLNGRHGRLLVPIGPRRLALLLTTTLAARNLRTFVARIRNLATELELPAEYTLPPDTEDFMTLSVFRRTSEVLTQQEIGGVLAGAHQAGHRLRDPYDTRVTEGYGGLATQSKLGLRTSDRTAQALAHLVVESREGVIGGPAADRALGVADLAAAELELVDPANLMTPVLSNEWKRITKSVGQSVYEVPLAGGAHAYCIFHLPWSACTKEGEKPDVAGCKIACPNKALTPDSVRGLQRRQQELEASKQDATAEEVIRADHLIDAYEEQIADSGLPLTSRKKKRRSHPR